MQKERKERPPIKSAPIRADKLEIVRRKSEETGITQVRLIDDLLDEAMRGRHWIADDVVTVCEQS